MKSPDEIRRLTHSYRRLRGYEQLPFAVAMFASVTADVMTWRPAGYSTTLLGFLALAAPVAYLIKRYYDRRFGVVKTASMGIGSALALFVGFLALHFVTDALSVRVHLGLLAAGVALAIYALRRFKLEGNRLLFAAFLAILSVWPPTGAAPAGAQWHLVFGFGFSALWIILAIWDHHTLVKAFERAPAAVPQPR